MLNASSRTPHDRTVGGRFSTGDRWACLVLLALAAWLFRHHVLGDWTYFGNPDRLNSDLKILAHYLSGLSRGHIAAWNEHEMMGYDSFVLPYTFPNPLVYLVALFGDDNIYVAMGYVAVALLALSGIAAYCFLRADLPAGLPVLVGAICYEFSSLTLLKVSQNSMSFSVFIAIPLLALAVRHTRRETAALCFSVLAILLVCMLNLMFLQKAAYALMLTGAYAVWRSSSRQSLYPVSVFCGALAVAIVFSAPRVLGVAAAIKEYVRVVEGMDLKDFQVLYNYQNILPYQFYRWFDYGIYGRTIPDGIAIGNYLNLTEGFLLYTSAIVPFILLTGLVRNPRGWLDLRRNRGSEGAFFFWALVACFAVVIWKPAAHAVFLLFLRMDFMHARILIAALLPLSFLVALTLAGLSPTIQRNGATLRMGPEGVVVGLLAALFIETVARQYVSAVVADDVPVMRAESLARIGLSLTCYLGLFAVLTRSKATALGHAAHLAICVLLVSQCLIAANDEINGRHVFNLQHPFNQGDFYYARREEFHPPSAEQLRALHQRIEPERYRVALICDNEIAGGFCGGHVPEFWRLRAIDGYYGLGVPRRLRALPWPTGPSLRTISFSSIESMPWDLLGFLNVRWVLVSSDGAYRNIVRNGDKITGRADPASFKIVPSPARVTPRVFFATAAEPVGSLEEAVKRVFGPAGIVDPEQTSFVEGMDRPRRFGGGGAITLEGNGDTLDLRFAAVPAERLLVLNDLYFPGWHADVDGHELPIFATNAVMRGVVVPPGADHLRFRYVTRSAAPGAWSFQLVAVFAAFGLFLGLRRISKT